MLSFNNLPIDVVKLIIIRYPVLEFVNKRCLQIIKKEGIKIPVRDIIQNACLVNWFLEKCTIFEDQFVYIALMAARPDALYRLLTLYQRRGKINYKCVYGKYRSISWDRFIEEKTNERYKHSLFACVLESRSLENIKCADKFSQR